MVISVKPNFSVSANRLFCILQYSGHIVRSKSLSKSYQEYVMISESTAPRKC